MPWLLMHSGCSVIILYIDNFMFHDRYVIIVSSKPRTTSFLARQKLLGQFVLNISFSKRFFHSFSVYSVTT